MVIQSFDFGSFKMDISEGAGHLSVTIPRDAPKAQQSVLGVIQALETNGIDTKSEPIQHEDTITYTISGRLKSAGPLCDAHTMHRQACSAARFMQEKLQQGASFSDIIRQLSPIKTLGKIAISLHTDAKSPNVLHLDFPDGAKNNLLAQKSAALIRVALEGKGIDIRADKKTRGNGYVFTGSAKSPDAICDSSTMMNYATEVILLANKQYADDASFSHKLTALIKQYDKESGSLPQTGWHRR